MSDDYIKDLEETVRKFMTPLKDVSFPVVIKAMSGHKVLSFDEKNNADQKLLKNLKDAIYQATLTANTQGIFSGRRNEVGNYIEPFVKNALNNCGLKAGTPYNTQGNQQTTGYPDIIIEDTMGRKIYLECKTYQQKSKDSPFRSFYFQASETSKITYDAMHLMVSFEIEEAQRNNKNAFIPVSWQIYSLETLRVQMKAEFNASNKSMYKDSILLAEGRI